MRSLVVLALFAAAGATGPAAVLTTDVPNGFELVSEPATDLTFEEYAALSPDATDHVDPVSTEALAMRAAVDVWSLGEDEILLREVTMWPTEEAASQFMERAVAIGAANELDPVDAPFEGAVAFIGADQGLWTRTLTWRQGPYAMTVSHFAVDEGNDGLISRTARSVADSVSDRTGNEVARSGVSAETAGPADDDASAGGGGIPIWTVLVWMFVVATGVWLFLKIKRNRDGHDDVAQGDAGKGDAGQGDDTSLADGGGDLDDIIERARARGRAERDIDEIPDPIERSMPPHDS